MSSGPFIGVRETRRIAGQYVLTEQDILATKSFDDAIVTGCWYLDQHPNKVTLSSANAVPKPQPKPYDIPYRSLLPRDVANLLVAGRCHSATQLAASSTRVTVTAMALGEAAGLAAARSVQSGVSPQELSGTEIRSRLAARGAGPRRDWHR
jgi:FAD dependent oxidoreductase